MKTDVGGWTTRLDDHQAARYAASGQWSGVTLARSAYDRATSDWSGCAIIDGDNKISFGTLLVKALRLADQLKSLGLRAGDVLSFQLPNWHEAAIINIAACLGGYVCNPIVAIYRDAEVKFILRDSRSKILFIPESFRKTDYVAMIERIRVELPDLETVVLVRASRAGYVSFDAWANTDMNAISSTRDLPPCPAIDPNAVKLLLYTSGTTGNPKGVLHSHNTVRAELDAVCRFWDITPADVILMASPVTHITGYLYALEIIYSAGIKAVLMEQWNAESAVRLIAAHKVTFSVGATPFLVEIVEAAASHAHDMTLPTLRLFGCGGAPVPEAIIHRAMRVLPNCRTFRIFGCTEAPTITAGVGRGDPTEKGSTTDGRILNHDVKVIDSSGIEVPFGIEGEIITSGPEVMLGYTRAEATAEAFDAAGYFHTGDLGFVTDDGFITISGRKKDLIIRGGENISPKEIEDILHTHPSIFEVAVVAMPDKRMGETPAAYVVLRPGTALVIHDVRKYLEDAGLARQKFPQRLMIVEELPKTASGKVLKTVLRERIAKETVAQQ